MPTTKTNPPSRIRRAEPFSHGAFDSPKRRVSTPEVRRRINKGESIPKAAIALAFDEDWPKASPLGHGWTNFPRP